jgi:hypothetical protein
MMNKDDLHEQQKVIVLVWRHGARTWDRFDGTVTKVAQKFVTIEYATWAGRAPEAVKFQIADQQVPSPYSYATHFRTLEQDARTVREGAARDGLLELGLDFRVGSAGSGERLSLDEQEVIIRVISLMRQGLVVVLDVVPPPGKEV